MKRFTSQKGFTLIELLVVITIITALAVTVFVALNPAQRLKDARDARRTSDVDSILTAIHQSIVDNKGSLPTALSSLTPGTEAQIGTGLNNCDVTVAGKCSATEAACANLMNGTVNVSKYLKTMPIDPLGSPAYSNTETGYTVSVDANGLVTVKSCGTEGTTAIESSR